MRIHSDETRGYILVHPGGDAEEGKVIVIAESRKPGTNDIEMSSLTMTDHRWDARHELPSLSNDAGKILSDHFLAISPANLR